MSRRAVFWTIAALAALLVVVVVGAIVFAWANGDELVDDAGGGSASYFAIFGLVFGDAVVPLLPGETTLTTASVLASQGKLELELVMLAGALGAVVGDSAVYWIARTGPTRLRARLAEASQEDERVKRGIELLDRSGPVLIAGGRFVPGLRFAVNVSMGLIEFPYRWFVLWSALGGIAWSIYTCLLAYWIGAALADFPLASIVISGVLTTVLIGAVYWVDRRRRVRSPAPRLTAP